ncbi:MAG TPA: hypothetical protein VM925_27995 [Labilithrix sp.]|nr:hypothetical protein [Labilithrix sp.]
MRAKALRVTGLSLSQMDDVTRWWERLTPAERRSLEVAARPRVQARFVEPGSDDADLAIDDFYEYVVNHELCFYEGKKFHICSAHAEAREVLSAGRIPASFQCPRASTECPMRRLLDQAPGCDVRLSLIGAEDVR